MPISPWVPDLRCKSRWCPRRRKASSRDRRSACPPVRSGGSARSTYLRHSEFSERCVQRGMAAAVSSAAMSKVASEEKAQFNAARRSSIRGAALVKNLFRLRGFRAGVGLQKIQTIPGVSLSNPVGLIAFDQFLACIRARRVEQAIRQFCASRSGALTRDFDTSSSTTSSASSESSSLSAPTARAPCSEKLPGKIARRLKVARSRSDSRS